MSVTDKHVKSAILSQFQEVAHEQTKPIVSLSDDQALLDLGLDSLGLAVVVARLEDLPELDPFLRPKMSNSRRSWAILSVLPDFAILSD